MLFKDRSCAGKKLASLLQKKLKKVDFVISLLRGGVVVGAEIARRFKIPHLPLPVAKISHPYNPELAIGALCFDKIYWENKNISNVSSQIKLAKEKFNSYLKRFSLKKSFYKKILPAGRQVKNKIVVLVDDGIATGATVKAAGLFLKSQKPKKLILASPVAPTDFYADQFDEIIIFHRDPFLSAISQYYESFPQVEDEEIKRFLDSASLRSE
jgi:putative phosphoribosyl transferase